MPLTLRPGTCAEQRGRGHFLGIVVIAFIRVVSVHLSPGRDRARDELR
jgi:hypothetical protein